MTKEELKQELYHYIATQCSAISINTEHRLVYHYDQMEKVGEFVYNLEEKQIEELENKIADIKANCDLAIEGRDIKIKELEQELTVEKDLHQEEVNLHLHAEEYIKSLEKENAELKNRDCWKSCEYANPKAELIGQHIKDVQNINKATELIERLLITSCNSDVLNLLPNCSEVLKVRVEAEQFIKDLEK